MKSGSDSWYTRGDSEEIYLRSLTRWLVGVWLCFLNFQALVKITFHTHLTHSAWNISPKPTVITWIKPLRVLLGLMWMQETKPLWREFETWVLDATQLTPEIRPQTTTLRPSGPVTEWTNDCGGEGIWLLIIWRQICPILHLISIYYRWSWDSSFHDLSACSVHFLHPAWMK